MYVAPNSNTKSNPRYGILEFVVCMVRYSYEAITRDLDEGEHGSHRVSFRFDGSALFYLEGTFSCQLAVSRGRLA